MEFLAGLAVMYVSTVVLRPLMPRLPRSRKAMREHAEYRASLLQHLAYFEDLARASAASSAQDGELARVRQALVKGLDR